MRYLGSKGRISKYIVPIIQSHITEDTTSYLEPFVGGANVIDKVVCKDKIGYDINKYLIALLNHVKENINDIPDRILLEEYQSVKANKDKYPDWYVGLVGFCSSFGAKFFGGYARNGKNDNSGQWSAGAIKTLKIQSQVLSDTTFICSDFKDIDVSNIKNSVIYCDPPYRGTTNYSTGTFDYELFYEWIEKLSANNTVLLSEYEAPEEYECIWSLETKTGIDSNKGNSNKDYNRVEKLFLVKQRR